MLLTQLITPQPGADRAQRRMTTFVMPVMTGFFFWHLASGLALYMCSSSIVNLALQVAIHPSRMGK